MSDENASNIIDPKYKGRYRGASDWVGSLIEDECLINVAEEGKKDKFQIDLDALFELAEANGVDCGEYKKQTDRPGAPGRLRMTVGNALRSRARKRHGLYRRSGKWAKVDDEFKATCPEEPTETKDGEPKKQKKTAEAA